MSVIATIYTNLAALNVTVTSSVQYGTVTPTAYAPGAVPPSGETGNLPMRIIDPVHNNDQGQYQFVAYGTTATVHWQITDLLLWDEVGQGRGPLDMLPDLVKYCGAYAEVIRQNRGIVFATAAIQQVTPRIGVYEWPRGTGVMFYGVEVTLSIEEVLSG